MNELPFYLQVLAGTPAFAVTLDDLDERTEVIRVFWQAYKMSLQHWYAFWDLMIIQSPSTGCVERVFSKFTNMYGAQQTRCWPRRLLFLSCCGTTAWVST